MSIGEDWDSSYRVDLGGYRTSVEVPCHGLIKVSVGDGKFFVKIFEDAAPVDPAWTERFLGLSRVPSQAVWSPLLFLERDGSPIAVDQVEKALGRRNGRAVIFNHSEDLGDKVNHNQVKDREVGGVLYDFFGHSKIKGEKLDGKKAVKDRGPRKSGPLKERSDFSKVGKISSCDSGLGSNEISKEGKVSDNMKLLTPVLTTSRISYLAVKGHVMKFRNSKSNFKMFWYLEEEISRIIRIGVALGLDFDNKKVGMADVFIEAKRKLKLGGLRELKVQ
ncbi:hypothetical protein LWI29_002838 [Acer saccharum]|uniref:Uncharacterized protein n=1 Tax=Acer saccharum TaxID=4024 RepID=A0AA39W005_ACESA|nr:hypothetical protein LWI29_002838 [Acer saccharum]